MHPLRSVWILIAVLLPYHPGLAQQPPPRDPQAIILLQQSLAAVSRVVLGDSLATGTVTLVAGSKTDTGTIRILTRGTDQSAEQITTADGTHTLVYSRGRATETGDNSSQDLQMELVVTSQCPDFPLPLLAGVLDNSDTAIQYVGLETLAGVPAPHIRFWRAFPGNPKVRHLEEFSVKDLWVDALSGLPRKLSYIQRPARGSQPALRVEVFYSDYRNVGGILYPFLIQKSLNGTPWATITIQNVAFNTGLADSDFPVQ